MTGLGRAIGAAFAAAVTAAAAGGLALLLVIFVGAQAADPGVGFDKPLGEQLSGLYSGVILWTLASLLLGLLPALCGAFGVLLPLHLVLARSGRTTRVWYLAVGLAAGLVSILLARNAFAYIEDWAQVQGLWSLLASAAVGGPAGALVFRQIVQGPMVRPKAAPTA